MNIGNKVETPEGKGIIVAEEKFKYSHRFGCKIKGRKEIRYYWIKEIKLEETK